MANLFFLVWLTVVFLAILWLFVGGVAMHLRNMGVPHPFSGLKLICPLQLVVAVGGIFLADRLGLHNPAGYSLAITVGTGVLGAAALWWWRRPLY